MADSPASTSAPSRSFQMASSSAEGAVPIRPADGLGEVSACVCAALTGSLLLLLPKGHATRSRLARQQVSAPGTLSTACCSAAGALTWVDNAREPHACRTKRNAAQLVQDAL